MKHMGKRLLALVLAAAMGILLLPFPSAQAAEPEEIDAQDYAALDPLWDEIADLEDTISDSPARRQAGEQSVIEQVAELVQQSDSYVPGSLTWQGDGAFAWKTDSGVACRYSLYLRQLARETKAPKEPVKEAKERSRTASFRPADVAVIGPYYGLDDSFTSQYADEAASIAAVTGGTSTVYSGADATIDTIAAALETSAVVFFDSHGDTDYYSRANPDDRVSGATTSYICLQSGEGITAADMEADHAFYAGYNPENTAMRYYEVDGTAIANHMERDSEGGMLWMAICLGMATDGLAGPLKARGLDTIYGYSQSVTFGGDYLFEEVFWDAMKDGATVAKAADLMKKTLGNWDYFWKYTTIASARQNYCAFPIVVSDEDPYPGKIYVNSLQTVKSTWTLPQPTFVVETDNPEGGTVSLLGNMIVAKPAADYILTGYTVEPEGAATLNGVGTTFTVSNLTQNCVITFHFFRPTFTASLDHVDGGTVTVQGRRITVEPAADYMLTGYTVEPEDAARLTAVGDTYTVTSLTADCTITFHVVRCPGLQFVDMPALNHWAHDGLDYMLDAGLMNGVSANRIDPEGNMTRAMLVTVLWRLEGEPEAEGTVPFVDLTQSWYQNAVKWAAENGVVNGVGHGKFEPDGRVTREQIATILYRYTQLSAGDVSKQTDLNAFPDNGRISGYAREALSWACAEGLIQGSAQAGKTMLLPQNPATRAQVSTILMRYSSR